MAAWCRGTGGENVREGVESPYGLNNPSFHLFGKGISLTPESMRHETRDEGVDRRETESTYHAISKMPALQQ